LVGRSSFQLLNVPVRFSGDGDDPKHSAFPEVTKINIGRSGGSYVLIEVPATAPTLREPGEIHLRRMDILNHCMEADQRSVGVRTWRVV
jgi:hypothetical protein